MVGLWRDQDAHQGTRGKMRGGMREMMVASRSLKTYNSRLYLGIKSLKGKGGY